MIDTVTLQSAFLARLTAAIPDIQTFDEVPQDTAYPYVRIESLNATDQSAKDLGIYAYDVTISAYYKVPDTGGVSGKEGAYAILKRIAAALHNQPSSLVMTGYVATTLSCAYETCLQEATQSEGTYYHGVQRYETLINDIATSN